CIAGRSSGAHRRDGQRCPRGYGGGPPPLKQPPRPPRRPTCPQSSRWPPRLMRQRPKPRQHRRRIPRLRLGVLTPLLLPPLLYIPPPWGRPPPYLHLSCPPPCPCRGMYARRRVTTCLRSSPPSFDFSSRPEG